MYSSIVTCTLFFFSVADFCPDPGGSPERGPDESDRGQDALHPGVAVAARVRNHSLPGQVRVLTSDFKVKVKVASDKCLASFFLFALQVPGRQAGGADRHHLQPPDPNGRRHRGRHQDLALQQHEAVERQLGDKDGREAA